MPLGMLRWSLMMLAAGAVSAAAQSADATLDRAVDAWSRVKTVRATFEQTLTNSLTGSSANAHGEFEEQRPNKLSVRFTDPADDRIVSDGSFVWLYLPSSAPGQVIKRRATDANAMPIDITGEFLDNPRARYDVTAGGTGNIAGHPAHEIVLLPKSGHTAAFDRARVWVDDDDGLVRQFEVTEPSGVTRRIRITALDVNVPVDRGAFTFTPPAGVRIVQR
jgi:outer membrane lipoprotein carrier protein